MHDVVLFYGLQHMPSHNPQLSLLSSGSKKQTVSCTWKK